MSRPLKRRPGWVLGAVGLVLVAACSDAGSPGAGGPPGTVIVALDGVDPITMLDTIQITGTITRTPAATTPLFVSVTGGLVAVTDTATESGRFTSVVPLRLNQLNTLTVTPKDGTGSAGQPATVTVLHDGSSPTVVLITPSGDGITTNPATVEVRLDEPVFLTGAGAGMSLRSGKLDVPGSAVLSSDSTTFLFTPTATLPENSIFAPVFTGVTDIAGNVPDVGTNACFVTELTVPAMDVFADTTIDDIFGLIAVGGPSPQFIDPPDMDQIRTAIQDSIFTMTLRFTSNRSFAAADSNNTVVLVEFDLDRDSTTGVRSIRDSLLIQVGADELTSGMGAEYVVAIDHLSMLGDSAAIGQYTGFNNFNILEVFWPQFCGPFVGFRVATTTLGNDDGDFDISVFALNFEGSGPLDPLIIDSAPDSGSFSVAYQGLFVPPMTVAPYRLVTRGVGSIRIPLLRSRR